MVKHWFSRISPDFLDHKFAESLIVLEDLTEDEIISLEQIYGCAVNRPSEADRVAWQTKRAVLRLKKPAWVPRPTAGNRVSQESLT